MIAYPDTSFLCALYRQQHNSAQAAMHFKGMKEPLHVTSLLLYEFRQSLRFQAWLHHQKASHGFSEKDAAKALADCDSDLKSGALAIVPADWAAVHQIGERLSHSHTPKNGHRAMDILHVATAIHLQATQLLTFDVNQRTLAAAGGLVAKP